VRIKLIPDFLGDKMKVLTAQSSPARDIWLNSIKRFIRSDADSVVYEPVIDVYNSLRNIVPQEFGELVFRYY
jgi:hypothetical protein